MAKSTWGSSPSDSGTRNPGVTITPPTQQGPVTTTSHRTAGQGERALAWIEAATFASVTYDLHRSYVDRDGDVWFFEDTISAEDGTWHMSSSADCYLNSLADVVLHWGPLKPYGHRAHFTPCGLADGYGWTEGQS